MIVWEIIALIIARETEKAELEVTLVQDNMTKPISDFIQPIEDTTKTEHEKPQI